MLMMYRTPENMANVMAPLSSVMPDWLVPRMVAPHAVPKRLANHSKGLVAATPGDGNAGDGETIFCIEDTDCYEGAGVCTAGAGCGSFGGAGYPVECYYVVAAEVDGC